MSYGQDESLVYKRIVKEVKGHKTFPDFERFKQYTRSGNKIKVHQTTIGFCGKVYPVIRVCVHRSEKGVVDNPKYPIDKVKECFSIEELDDFVKSTFKEKYYESYCEDEYKRVTKHWGWMDRREIFKEYFDKAEKQKDKFAHLFEQEHCPIFLATRYHPFTESPWHSLVYNSPLKDTEFVRLFDPYQTYQQVSMFLGNMAEPRKPIPKIDDLTMSQIKGFDKFSFRKDKNS